MKWPWIFSKPGEEVLKTDQKNSDTGTRNVLDTPPLMTANKPAQLSSSSEEDSFHTCSEELHQEEEKKEGNPLRPLKGKSQCQGKDKNPAETAQTK